MNKKLYHGSTKLLKILKPNLDKRLNVFGLFVSDEIYGPMAFSLLPDSSEADVIWSTKNGKFISGEITTPEINESGYLYEINNYNINDLKTLDTGDLYFTKNIIPNRIFNCKKDQLINFGFEINVVSI